MKALIIGQKVSLSIYSRERYVHQIYVPDANHLVFGIWENQVVANEGYDFKDANPDVIMEISVSKDLIEKIQNVIRANTELQNEAVWVKKLLALADS